MSAAAHSDGTTSGSNCEELPTSSAHSQSSSTAARSAVHRSGGQSRKRSRRSNLSSTNKRTKSHIVDDAVDRDCGSLKSIADSQLSSSKRKRLAPQTSGISMREQSGRNSDSSSSSSSSPVSFSSNCGEIQGEYPLDDGETSTPPGISMVASVAATAASTTTNTMPPTEQSVEIEDEHDEVCYVEFTRSAPDQAGPVVLAGQSIRGVGGGCGGSGDQDVPSQSQGGRTSVRTRQSVNGGQIVSKANGLNGVSPPDGCKVQGSDIRVFRTNGLTSQNGINGTSRDQVTSLESMDSSAFSRASDYANSILLSSGSTVCSPGRERIVRHRVRRRTGLSLSSVDHEVIRLISQHLTDMGLQTSARVLLHESGCRTDSAKASLFRLYVIKGRWTEALLVVGSSSELVDNADDRTQMKFLILEQMYFELLLQDRRVDALKILQHELTPMCHNRTRLHVLSSYLMASVASVISELTRLVGERRPTFATTAAWPSTQSVQQTGSSQTAADLIGRARCALMDKLQSMIPPTSMLPPRRLSHLLRQASQFQIDRCLYHNSVDDSSKRCLPPSLPVRHPESLINDARIRSYPTSSAYQNGGGCSVANGNGLSKSFSVNDIGQSDADVVGHHNNHSNGGNNYVQSPVTSYVIDHVCTHADSLPTRTAQILTEHIEEVVFCAFSPSGYRLATGSKDATVIVFEVDPVALRLTRLRHLERSSQGVSQFTWSPDSTRLAVCGSDDCDEICIWNVETGLVEAKISHGEEDSLSVVAWSDEGDRICCGGLRGQFYQCDNDGVVIDSWEGVRVQAVQYYKTNDDQPTSTTTFQAGQQRSVAAAATAGPHEVGHPPGLVGSGSGATANGLNTNIATDSDENDCSIGGRRVLAADTHNRLRVYDFDSLSDQTLIQEEYGIMSFTLSGNKQYALLNMANQGLHLWDLASRTLIRKYVGVSQGYYVVHSCFGGANDNFIASGSEDAKVYIYHSARSTADDVSNLAEFWPQTSSPLASPPIAELQGHSRTVNCVSWNRMFPHLMASVSDDSTIRLWAPSQMVEDVASALRADGVTEEDKLPPPSQHNSREDSHSSSSHRRPHAASSSSSMSGSQNGRSNSHTTARGQPPSSSRRNVTNRSATAQQHSDLAVSPRLARFVLQGQSSSSSNLPTTQRSGGPRRCRPTISSAGSTTRTVDLTGAAQAVAQNIAECPSADVHQSLSGNSLLRRIAFPIGLANIHNSPPLPMSQATSSVQSISTRPVELLFNTSTTTAVSVAPFTAASSFVTSTHQSSPMISAIRVQQSDDHSPTTRSRQLSIPDTTSGQPPGNALTFRTLSNVDALPLPSDASAAAAAAASAVVVTSGSHHITLIEAPSDIVQTYDHHSRPQLVSVQSLPVELTCETPIGHENVDLTTAEPLTMATLTRPDLVTLTQESGLALTVDSSSPPSGAMVSNGGRPTMIQLDASAGFQHHHQLL